MWGEPASNHIICDCLCTKNIGDDKVLSIFLMVLIQDNWEIAVKPWVTVFLLWYRRTLEFSRKNAVNSWGLFLDLGLIRTYLTNPQALKLCGAKSWFDSHLVTCQAGSSWLLCKQSCWLGFTICTLAAGANTLLKFWIFPSYYIIHFSVESTVLVISPMDTSWTIFRLSFLYYEDSNVPRRELKTLF